MLILVLFLGACALAAGVRATMSALRALPRSNEDWVWY